MKLRETGKIGNNIITTYRHVWEYALYTLIGTGALCNTEAVSSRIALEQNDIKRVSKKAEESSKFVGKNIGQQHLHCNDL